MDVSGYGEPGRTLVAGVLTEMAEDGLEPDARDRALLDLAARLSDRLAVLEELVQQDGERSVSKTGIVRAHPLLAEVRNVSLTIAKIVGGVQLGESSGKNPVKQKAAAARWRSHNEAKAARAASGASGASVGRPGGRGGV